MSRFGWAYVNGVITGSGIPGGSDKQVQFNSGSIFSGSQNFVYNYPSSSLQLGNQVTASGQYSFAQGERNVASGYTSHAQGIDTTANAAYSHAEGDTTTASGVSSHAEGQLTLASGVTSHAEGIYSIASGGSSHAEGNTTLASAYGTHAEGYQTTASQNYAHAEGVGPRATNYGAHAEGNYTLASGEKAHAEGSYVTASGFASHAEGSNTNASGAYSHAEGANTIAVGSFSHAGGEGTISSGSAQTVYGKYNKQNNSTSLFVIGNGTSNASRNDILLVNTNDVVISGSLRVSGTLYATEYQTTVVSSSIIYSSGSTKFGDDAGDIHQFTGSILGDIVSGTIARFTTITGSNITSSNFIGNGSNITNLTASNITNFTDNVRAQFTQGTNITIVDGVISSTGSGGSGSPGGANTQIQFNSGSTFSGSSNLIYDYTNNILSGTTSRFTIISGSNITSSTGLLVGGATTIGGNLTVNGGQTSVQSFTASAGISSSAGLAIGGTARIVGNVTLDNNLIVSGNITLGNASTDIVTSNAQFTASNGLSASVINVTDKATTRTNLGLGTIATQNANSVTITGGTGQFTTLSASSTIQAGGAITGSAGLNISGGPTNIGGGAGQNVTISTSLQVTGPTPTFSNAITASNGISSAGAIIKGTPTVAKGTGLHIKQADNSDGAGVRLESTGSSATAFWDIFYTSADNLQFAYNNSNKGFLNDLGTNAALNFTGQHRCNTINTNDVLYYKDKIGLIVVSTGQYLNTQGNMTKPTINESLPKIELSNERNQKTIFGVISDTEDINSLERVYSFGIYHSIMEKESTVEDTRVIVNSIGEGGIWVCNINGDFQNGDYITTCEINGYGMKQDDDLLHNYTVAKITQDCSFELNNPNYDCVEFQFSGSTYRKAFVGCTYHCG
jgi:hypothetical protein